MNTTLPESLPDSSLIATHEVLCDYWEPKKGHHVAKWFPCILTGYKFGTRPSVRLLELPFGYHSADLEGCSPVCVREVAA